MLIRYRKNYLNISNYANLKLASTNFEKVDKKNFILN